MSAFISVDQVAEDVKVIIGISVELVPVEQLVQERTPTLQLLIGFDRPEREPVVQITDGRPLPYK
jgi:hypothetical protein